MHEGDGQTEGGAPEDAPLTEAEIMREGKLDDRVDEDAQGDGEGEDAA